MVLLFRRVGAIFSATFQRVFRLLRRRLLCIAFSASPVVVASFLAVRWYFQRLLWHSSFDTCFIATVIRLLLLLWWVVSAKTVRIFGAFNIWLERDHIRKQQHAIVYQKKRRRIFQKKQFLLTMLCYAAVEVSRKVILRV